MNYDFCNELVNGFVEAIDEETKIKLHREFLVSNAGPLARNSPTAYDTFVAKELRAMIVNKLLKSEYGTMFSELADDEIAKLLGMKNFGSYYQDIAKKLRLLRIREKDNVLDMKETMEQCEYTKPHHEMEVSDA